MVSTDGETQQLRKQYEAGGFGYGHAKQALFEALLTKFSSSRTRFDELMEQPEKMEETLQQGAKKAQQIAAPVLARVRSRLGFS
jgi:tryptophanyl-tRNA synthetase